MTSENECAHSLHLVIVASFKHGTPACHSHTHMVDWVDVCLRCLCHKLFNLCAFNSIKYFMTMCACECRYTPGNCVDCCTCRNSKWCLLSYTNVIDIDNANIITCPWFADIADNVITVTCQWSLTNFNVNDIVNVIQFVNVMLQ